MLVGYLQDPYVNHDNTIELNWIILQFQVEWTLIGYFEAIYVKHKRLEETQH